MIEGLTGPFGVPSIAILLAELSVAPVPFVPITVIEYCVPLVSPLTVHVACALPAGAEHDPLTTAFPTLGSA